MLNAVIK